MSNDTSKLSTFSYHLVFCHKQDQTYPSFVIPFENINSKKSCKVLTIIDDKLQCLRMKSDEQLDSCFEELDDSVSILDVPSCNLISEDGIHYCIEGHKDVSFTHPDVLSKKGSLSPVKSLKTQLELQAEDLYKAQRHPTARDVPFQIESSMFLIQTATPPVGYVARSASEGMDSQTKINNSTLSSSAPIRQRSLDSATSRHRALSDASQKRVNELKTKDIGQQVLNSEFPLVETICVSLSAFWDQICEIFIIRETKEEKIDIIGIFFACLQKLHSFVEAQLTKIMQKLASILRLKLKKDEDTLRKILRQSYPGWRQHLFVKAVHSDKSEDEVENTDVLQLDDKVKSDFDEIMKPFFDVIDAELDDSEEVKKMSTWTDFIINLAEMQISDPKLEFDFDETPSFGAAQLNPNYHEEYDRSPNGTEAVIAFPAVVTAAHRNVRKKAQVLIF